MFLFAIFHQFLFNINEIKPQKQKNDSFFQKYVLRINLNGRTTILNLDMQA